MSRAKTTSELFETFTEYLIERYGTDADPKRLKNDLSDTIDEMWRNARKNQKNLKSTSDTNQISGTGG